ALTSADWTSSRLIQATNTAPCRWTTGGAGGQSPCNAGMKQCIPNPPKTNRHIAAIIQKENDGRNRRTTAGGAAAMAAWFIGEPLFLSSVFLPHPLRLGERDRDTNRTAPIREVSASRTNRWVQSISTD